MRNSISGRRSVVIVLRVVAVFSALEDSDVLFLESDPADSGERRDEIREMRPHALWWLLNSTLSLPIACTILAGVDRERAIEAHEQCLNEIYTMWRVEIETLLDVELARPDLEEFEGGIPEEFDGLCAEPDTKAAQEYSDAIMLTREQKWVEVIDHYVRENDDDTIFAAVGLGHLHEGFDGKMPEILKYAGFERVR